MGTAAWADFKGALDIMEPGAVASKDVTNAFHWIAARTHGQWNTGGPMSAGKRSHWLAWGTPLKY